MKNTIEFVNHKFTSKFGEYVCDNVSTFSWKGKLYFHLKGKDC